MRGIQPWMKRPSVSVVWKIARAFDVHFSALLATTTRAATSVLRAAQATRLESPDGRFSSRALFPLGDQPEPFAAVPGSASNVEHEDGRLRLTVGIGLTLLPLSRHSST